MPHFIKVGPSGEYVGEVFTSGKETTLAAVESDQYYIPGAGRTDGPWEGKVYDRGADSWSTPVPVARPAATIIVYTTDVAAPVEEANVSQAVNFQVTIPGVGEEQIVVPIDRLNAQNEVQESGVAWLALQFASDVATGSVTFPRSGRYGVGPWTSQKRFNVPLKYVTVLGA